MTAQQIEYWKLKEAERANLANEAENKRYHMKSEYLNAQVNAENARHNRAIEAINRANMEINARNAAISALEAATHARLAALQEQRDAETARHNAASEAIDREYNEKRLEMDQYKVDVNEQIATEDRGSAEKRSFLQSGLSFLGGLGLNKLINSGGRAVSAGAAANAAAAKAATTDAVTKTSTVSTGTTLGGGSAPHLEMGLTAFEMIIPSLIAVSTEPKPFSTMQGPNDKPKSARQIIFGEYKSSYQNYFPATRNSLTKTHNYLGGN